MRQRRRATARARNGERKLLQQQVQDRVLLNCCTQPGNRVRKVSRRVEGRHAQRLVGTCIMTASVHEARRRVVTTTSTVELMATAVALRNRRRAYARQGERHPEAGIGVVPIAATTDSTPSRAMRVAPRARWAPQYECNTILPPGRMTLRQVGALHERANEATLAARKRKYDSCNAPRPKNTKTGRKRERLKRRRMQKAQSECTPSPEPPGAADAATADAATTAARENTAADTAVADAATGAARDSMKAGATVADAAVEAARSSVTAGTTADDATTGAARGSETADTVTADAATGSARGSAVTEGVLQPTTGMAGGVRAAWSCSSKYVNPRRRHAVWDGSAAIATYGVWCAK